MTVPVLIKHVHPEYPPDAKKSHIEGTVLLCVTIGKDGHVRVGATRGPKELVPAAVKAVQQWRYRPFLANNQPVEADTTITVNFRLNGIEVSR